LDLAFITLSCLQMFLGTLPYLSVFGVVTGLVVGGLAGILVLPYVTLGRWGHHARLVLISLSAPLLLLGTALLVHLFVNVQTLEGCGVCEALKCVPYTASMCNDELRD